MGNVGILGGQLTFFPDFAGFGVVRCFAVSPLHAFIGEDSVRRGQIVWKSSSWRCLCGLCRGWIRLCHGSLVEYCKKVHRRNEQGWRDQCTKEEEEQKEQIELASSTQTTEENEVGGTRYTTSLPRVSPFCPPFQNRGRWRWGRTGEAGIPTIAARPR